jgi:type II secretory pathway component GspD/PulD (secretin)
MCRLCLSRGTASVWLALFFVGLVALSTAAQEAETTVTGLEAKVPVFEVDNRPVKEVLNLLARFSNLNFITTLAVQDVPITAKMSDVTVKQILDTVLPRYGLNYIKKPGEDFITVMTQQEYDAEVKEKPEMKTKVFDLKYVSIENVAPVLTQLKSPDGILFIIPHQRRIIATDYLERLEEMDRTIRELDTPTVRRVFRLKYINAEEARQQLQQVLSQNATVQVDPINNTLIIEDIPANVAEAEAIIADLDRQRPLVVFEIQYADPAEIIDMIQALGILTEQAQIDFHEGTNKILLQDIPSRVELAKQVIEALDAPPLQIYIEARITDVNLDRLFELDPGYEWGRGVGVTSATGGLAIEGPDAFVRFLSGRVTVTDLTDLFGRNFKVVVDMLESDGVLRTVSTPFGRVRNHSILYFQDGAEEPFLVRQRRIGTVTTSADEIFTQRTRSVGRIIEVVPHANSSGHVYLEVSVEDSDAENVTLEGQTLLRVIEKTVETEVDVKTGHTVALGGLIFEKEDRDVSGIRWLKDIPILGIPFRSERTERIRRKLVIFITPYVENLEDPFEAYEPYVASEEEGLGEFDELGFNWDDEEGPALGEGGVFHLDDMDELPEETRESLKGLEDEETPEGGVEWISPEDELPSGGGSETEGNETEGIPEATGQGGQLSPNQGKKPDPLDARVPVF